jgi:hypothetical protein
MRRGFIRGGEYRGSGRGCDDNFATGMEREGEALFGQDVRITGLGAILCSLFSVLYSLFSVLCSLFSVLGSVIAARGGGQRLKLAERWGAERRGPRMARRGAEGEEAQGGAGGF